MAYVRQGNRIVRTADGRRVRVLSGLGGASDCSPSQSFYPNLTFNGITGQCSTASEAAAALKSGAATGNLDGPSGGTYGSPAPGTGGSGAFTSFLNSFASIFGSKVAPTPAPTGPVVQQSGMSTTTKVAIAGGAVLVVALLATR